VLVVTGSQGEASAALARIAADEHRQIHIGAGDVVLISATPVPGNEETVSETIDNLFRRGANVVFSSTEGRVHVSGHAARGRTSSRRSSESSARSSRTARASSKTSVLTRSISSNW
jgi:mRNA degradation ribonuclease J1/J2